MLEADGAGSEGATGAAPPSVIGDELNLTFFEELLRFVSSFPSLFGRFRLLVEWAGANIKEGCARLSAFCAEDEAVILASLS